PTWAKIATPPARPALPRRASTPLAPQPWLLRARTSPRTPGRDRQPRPPRPGPGATPALPLRHAPRTAPRAPRAISRRNESLLGRRRALFRGLLRRSGGRRAAAATVVHLDAAIGQIEVGPDVRHGLLVED